MFSINTSIYVATTVEIDSSFLSDRATRPPIFTLSCTSEAAQLSSDGVSEMVLEEDIEGKKKYIRFHNTNNVRQ